MSHGGDGNLDRKEVLDGNNHDDKEVKKSPSEANEENKEDEGVTMMLGWHTTAAESSPLTIVKKEEMFLRLGFSQVVAQKPVESRDSVPMNPC